MRLYSALALSLLALVALRCLAAAPGASAVAGASGTWTLTTADFQTQSVALRSIDADGVKVANAGQEGGAGGGERVVPFEQFMQLERTGAAGGADAAAAAKAGEGKFTLYLVGGDRVAGEPVGIQKEQVLWKNPAVGELAIPLTRVAAMTKSGPPAPGARRAEDVVSLANGDAVRGIVGGMTKDAITVKTAAGDPADVPLASVTSVTFATAAGAGDGKARGFRVRLDDGSSLVGSALSGGANGKVELTLGKDAARPIDLARVVAVEQVNGPVAFLTSRPPAEDVFVPYLGPAPAHPPTRFNTDVEGQPFFIGGRSYSRGIGVHSYSRLVYPLDGNYRAFRVQYGMNDSLDRGDVTVRIKLDDKVVHEQADVRPGRISPVVVVDLGKSKQLVLEVGFGEGIHTQDRLNWIEPALLKEKPAPPPPPTTVPTTRPATMPTTAPTTRPAAAK